MSWEGLTYAARLPVHLAHAFLDEGAIAGHVVGAALEDPGRMAASSAAWWRLRLRAEVWK